MLIKKDTVIKCPYCDYEYLPGEIYLPKYFLGQPKDIERTIEGKIDIELGVPQDTTESYTCDKCNKPFKVWATISYETQKDPAHDFDSDYVSTLFSNRISLEE